MGGKSFLNITLDPETIKQKREIFNYIKIKHSCVAKTTVNQTKDTYHRRTIFSLIYKALLSNTKKMTNISTENKAQSGLPKVNAPWDWLVFRCFDYHRGAKDSSGIRKKKYWRDLKLPEGFRTSFI